MPVAKLETTGSTNTYDSSLGNIVTRVFQCWLEDADALWAEFSHNQNYPERGGYFIRTRSSIERGPGFATARLVFAEKTRCQPEFGRVRQSRGWRHGIRPRRLHHRKSSWRRTPITRQTGTMSCGRSTAPPAARHGGLPRRKFSLTTRTSGKKYQWVKPGTTIAGWYRLFEVYHEAPRQQSIFAASRHGVPAGDHQPDAVLSRPRRRRGAGGQDKPVACSDLHRPISDREYLLADHQFPAWSRRGNTGAV